MSNAKPELSNLDLVSGCKRPGCSEIANITPEEGRESSKIWLCTPSSKYRHLLVLLLWKEWTFAQ